MSDHETNVVRDHCLAMSELYCDDDPGPMYQRIHDVIRKLQAELLKKDEELKGAERVVAWLKSKVANHDRHQDSTMIARLERLDDDGTHFARGYNEAISCGNRVLDTARTEIAELHARIDRLNKIDDERAAELTRLKSCAVSKYQYTIAGFVTGYDRKLHDEGGYGCRPVFYRDEVSQVNSPPLGGEPQSNATHYECPDCGSAVPHGVKCHHNL